MRSRSSGASAERVGQRQQNPADLLGFLLLERDDVVVDLDRAERLEKQARAAARAAVDDARNRGAVLGADDQHVAAVAVGDDLLLQVLRGVLAAQVRFERPAQPRPLLAQPIADASQLRARVVHHLAARVDLAADVGDLALEGGRPVRDRAEDRTCAARAAHRRCRPTSTDARNAASASRCSASSARPSTRERLEDRVEIVRRVQGQLVVAEEADRLGRRRQRVGHRARLGQRMQPREPGGTRRGQREAADRLDNAIEFEGPQGACMHRALIRSR